MLLFAIKVLNQFKRLFSCGTGIDTESIKVQLQCVYSSVVAELLYLQWRIHKTQYITFKIKLFINSVFIRHTFHKKMFPYAWTKQKLFHTKQNVHGYFWQLEFWTDSCLRQGKSIVIFYFSIINEAINSRVTNDHYIWP